MSILARVESARKATAPIVGIPVEGERPFCLRRSLLVDSLKGLTLIDAGIQAPLEGTRRDSLLVLYATGPKVQAIRRIIPFSNMYQLKIELWKWAKAERLKRAKPKVKMSGRQRQIEKLHKKLAKMNKPHIPRHPLLYDLSEARSKYQHEQYQEAGKAWAAWKREVRIRRWIQLQARECKAGKFNTGKLYQILTERGLKVTKWSDVPTHRGSKYSPVSRSNLPDVFTYLDHLWEFCGLQPRLNYWFDPESEQDMGAQFYVPWLEHLHEYKELESMIAGLEAV